MPLLEYERARKDAAKRLGFAADDARKVVQAKRDELGSRATTTRQGRAISFPEPEPWPEPVDGAALLDEIAARHRATSSWASMRATRPRCGCPHLSARCFMISPRLAVRSPMKRCGKTTLLDVLAAGPSAAADGERVTAAAVSRGRRISADIAGR